MDFENLFAAPDIRQVDMDAPVETAWPQQRLIQYIRAVGGDNHNHAGIGFKTVHLDQHLIERLLALIVCAACARARWPGRPTASISSIKIMHGACFFAWLNISRTRAAPTPTNISTKSEPEMLKKGTFASPAMARASTVFPVPGGPINNTPRGI